jgi:hypothetical protein
MKDSTGRRLDSFEVARADILKLTRGRQLSPVTNRAAPSFATNLSDGVVRGGTARIRHTVTQTSHGIVLAFSNTYNSAGYESNGPQDITVSAGIEHASGQVTPAYFNGQRQVTIKPGGTAFTDPLGVTLVKGATIFSRTFISVVTAATKFPQGGFIVLAANSEGHNYASGLGAELTNTGDAVPSGGADARVFGPSAILGLPTHPTTVLGVVGDSIAAGAGDVGVSGGPDDGWIVRALAGNYAYQRVALTGQAVDAWFASEGSLKWRQQAILDRVGPTHLICELGINSISQGFTTLSARLLGNGYKGAWSILSAYGVPLYATTLTPKTTSTDNWVTTTNQTVTADEAARVAYNNWLRDGAPITTTPISGGVPAAVGSTNTIRAGQVGHPLSGWLEVADLAETARNSGIWKANSTADGLHPNNAMHATLSASLSPEALGLIQAK